MFAELQRTKDQLAVLDQGTRNIADALNNNTDVIGNALARMETILNIGRLINNLILQGRREEIVLTLDGQPNYDHYAMYWDVCVGFVAFVEGLKRFDAGRSELISTASDEEVIIFGGT